MSVEQRRGHLAAPGVMNADEEYARHSGHTKNVKDLFGDLFAEAWLAFLLGEMT
jgi:hypothetical protein